MKRVTAILLCFMFLFCGCSGNEASYSINKNITLEEITPINKSENIVSNKSELIKYEQKLAKKETSRPSINSSKNFYKNLLNTENEKKAYDALYSGFQSQSTLVSIPAMSTTDIKKIYEYVRLDNPQFYYIPKMFNVLKNGGIKYEISLKYGVVPDAKDFEEIVDRITLQINKLDSEYKKVKYIYKYIIDSSTYSTNNKGIYSMLVAGYGSCEGYSELFKYLCDKIGIESLIVTGKSRDSAHQWNMVKIEDSWYYVDSTWGDPINSDVNFDYLCITEAEISKSHEIDRLEYLPLANCSTSNYFVKTGLILDSTNENDIYEVFETAYKINQTFISFKMTEKEVFDKNVKSIDDWIYKALRNINYSGNHITYNTNDELFVLNIKIL